MWSSAVLDPADPGRSRLTRSSSVLSQNINSGWWPYPLKLGSAGSLSECAGRTEASRSSTVIPVSSRPLTLIQGKPPGRRSSCWWTWIRVRARAEAIFVSWTGPIASRVRHSVDAEAGRPRTSEVWRITSIPAIDRAPSRTAQAAETRTVPRSWTGRKSRRTRAAPSASVSPTLSARRRTGTMPALPTSFFPLADSDRSSAHSVRFDTRRVPPPQHDPVLNKPDHRRSMHPPDLFLTLCHRRDKPHEFLRQVVELAAGAL